MTAAPNRLRATLALLVVTLIWGGTFVWNKQAVEATEETLGPGGATVGIGLFLMLRFGLAALLMPLWRPARQGLHERGNASGGLWLAIPLTLGFVLQMFGLQDVSPAVSAFLTSLYVVFTALIGRFTGRSLGWHLWAGVGLATLGAAFIEGRPDLTFGLGELLLVVSAFIFAVHILITDHVTRRRPPLAVTTWSFGWVAVGAGLLTAFGWLRAGEAVSVEAVIDLVLHPGFLWPLVLTTVLATNLALSLMNLFQRELPPVRAAVLYACEPIWASLYGWATGHDTITTWLVFGGGALLLGNLLTELGPRMRAVPAAGPQGTVRHD